jgi:DnaJ-class molecular chaperone
MIFARPTANWRVSIIRHQSGKRAENTFKDLSVAYDVLMIRKGKLYDEFGEAGLRRF